MRIGSIWLKAGWISAIWRLSRQQRSSLPDPLRIKLDCEKEILVIFVVAMDSITGQVKLPWRSIKIEIFFTSVDKDWQHSVALSVVLVLTTIINCGLIDARISD